MGSAIQNIPNPQLRRALSSMYERAGNDLSQFEAEVAYWFDQSMQRLAGAYKRTIQVWTVVFGLVLAMVFNIDFSFVQGAVVAPDTGGQYQRRSICQRASGDGPVERHQPADRLGEAAVLLGADGPHWNYGLE